ncbi:serine hydrolase domain-containing protein [Desulfomarina sp.]
MRIIIACFFVSVITVMTSCAIAPQRSSIYRGLPKHLQPSLDAFPAPNSYVFNQKLDDSMEKEFNLKVDYLFLKHHIAGISATILVPDKGIWETNRGFISKPDNILVDSSTVFFWASVGKLITSTIVHQLILEGKLSFDDKLSKWFPDIQNSKEISIEQLLTHTNGIYPFNADPDVHSSNKKFSPEEFIEISKSHDNLFEPGEYWSYTNTGYLLLTFIIENIESKSFSQEIRDRISIPLNLETLKTPTKDDTSLALAHDKDTVIYKDYSVILGAGGIVSNSKDMAVFLSALLTGKIIPIKDVHNMMKDLYPMFDKGLYYGRGIMLYDFNQTDNIWIGHSGGTENYRAILAYDVQTKAIIAISINENISVESVAYKLIELIATFKK